MSPLLMNTPCTEIEDQGTTPAQLKMKMAGVESENRVVTEVQSEKVAKRSSRVTNRASSAASLKSVVLTERDFDVLTFVLDMKFASAREVFLKFFRVTNENNESKSDAWAKKRLFQLEKAGFLRGA